MASPSYLNCIRKILIFTLFVETLGTLDNCKASIESSCKHSVTEAEMTVTLSCNDDAKAYYEAVDKCLQSRNDSAGCACFNALDIDTLYDKVKACNTTDATETSINERNKCRDSKLNILYTEF